MNNIDVTRADESVPLADSDRVAHERVVFTVRWLLAHTDATQRKIADVLQCDVSSVQRALLLEDKGRRHRRRGWRATEIFRMALYFDVPPGVFYTTKIAEVWAVRSQEAEVAHEALLASLRGDS